MTEILQQALRSLVTTEYHARETELRQYLRAAPLERVRTGRSVLLRIAPAGVMSLDDDIVLTGSTPYREHPRVTDGALIAHNNRIKGQRGTSSGDFLTVTRLDPDTLSPLDPAKRKPRNIMQSPLATVNSLSVGENQQLTVQATIMNVDWRGPCLQRHEHATLDSDASADELALPAAPDGENRASGDPFYIILDPAVDDIPLNRASYLLRDIDQSSLFQTIAGIWHGRIESPTVPRPNPAALRRFVDYLQENVGPETYPNEEQQAAIVAGDALAARDPKLLGCQGIPGAGKTSGYLVPALLGRLYAALQSDHLPRIVLTAPSNTAIDRAVEAVADLYEQCQELPGADLLRDLQIVRLSHTRPQPTAVPSTVSDHVEYLSPTDTDRVEALRDDCLRAETATDPVVVAATPSSIYSLIGNLYRSYSPGKLLRDQRTYFDLLAIDEASMLTLPQLCLAGAYLTETAPVLAAGDHRQLGPIWTRTWREDPQPLIQQTVPYLSVLEYIRLLAGESIDGIDRTALAADPDADIPLPRLTTTYRLSETLARLSEESVYRDDVADIQTPTPSRPAPFVAPTTALTVVGDPTVDVAVILHDETDSRRANATEAAIVAALTETVLLDEVGIIAPYNAHRGQLQTTVATDDGELPSQVSSIDTVNRNQGREHEIAIYSASASLPAYLGQQESFFWNDRRLNVAFTRAKKKLIVVASRASFATLPVSDKNTFENAQHWWRLAAHVGLDDDPAWGPQSLTAFHPTLTDETTTVEIYTAP